MNCRRMWMAKPGWPRRAPNHDLLRYPVARHLVGERCAVVPCQIFQHWQAFQQQRQILTDNRSPSVPRSTRLRQRLMQIPLDIQPEMADTGAEHQVGLLQQFRPVLLGIQPLKLVA